MDNSCRGPTIGEQKLFKKLSKKYPYLQTVKEQVGELGVLRVRRKSFKEIEEMLKALSKSDVEYRYYDCLDSAAAQSQGYSILYVSLYIENLPVLSQTVVFILKEENTMGKRSQIPDLARADAALRSALVYYNKTPLAANIVEEVMDRAVLCYGKDSPTLSDGRAVEYFNRFRLLTSIWKEGFPFTNSLKQVREEFKVPDYLYYEVMKFTDTDFQYVEKVLGTLFDILDAQLADWSEDLLKKAITRTRDASKEYWMEGKFTEDALFFAEQALREWKGSFDEALGMVSVDFGYNPNTGKWDGSYHPPFRTKVSYAKQLEEIRSIPNVVYLRMHTVDATLDTDDDSPAETWWNSWLLSFEKITEDQFLAQPLSMDRQAGLEIYQDEKTFDEDGSNFLAEAEQCLTAFVPTAQHEKDICLAVRPEGYEDLYAAYQRSICKGKLLYIAYSV